MCLIYLYYKDHSTSHVYTDLTKLKTQQNDTLCTQEHQPRSKITNKTEESSELHSWHQRPSPISGTTTAGTKKEMTNHLHTRARSGSIADMHLCGPPRWLANKDEAIAVEWIRSGQHPGHIIELQIWYPAQLRHRRRKPYLPATNHEAITRSTIFQMPLMQTTICICSWTTSQAPRRCWTKHRRNDGARGHRSTTRMLPPLHHACLNTLVSKSTPKADHLIGKGSKDLLVGAAIATAEDKTMNIPKP